MAGPAGFKHLSRRTPEMGVERRAGVVSKSTANARDSRFVDDGGLEPLLSLRCVLYDDCSSGQTSTTPCATAQGVRDAISMASAKSAASIMAKPATGNDDVINGPFAVST